jgi:hypothetical protein
MSKKPSDRKLKFGVVCQSTELIAWEALCVEELLKPGNTKLALVVIAGSPDPRSEENAHQSTILRAFRKHFAKPTAFDTASSEDLPSDALILRCKIQEAAGAPGSLDEDDVELIGRLDLDFFIHFGCRGIREDLAALAVFGIWFFPHDCDERSAAGIPFFDEVKQDRDAIEVELMGMRDRNEKTSVLKRGWFKNVKESYCETLDRIYFETAKWPSDLCRQLQRHNMEALPNDGSKAYSLQVELPDPFQIVACMLVLLKNLFLDKYQSLFRHDQWSIGIVQAPIHRFLEQGARPKVQWLPLVGRNVFRADPFGIPGKDKLTILCEEFDYRSPTGFIAWTEVSDTTARISSGTVFRNSFHMSYPYLFQHDGEIYCVPETAEAGKMEILRAIAFPDEWATIGEIGAGVCGVDPTVFAYEGIWWAACTRKDRDENLNLFLWYAEELQGPWKPHGRNPVKTDVRSSRSAGTPFVHQGTLYRPAQDSSALYGGRVVINRVARLTPDEFDEEIAAAVEPYADGPYSRALHTLSAAGDRTIIDSMRFTFVWVRFKKVFLGWFRKTGNMLRNLVFGRRNG